MENVCSICPDLSVGGRDALFLARTVGTDNVVRLWTAGNKLDLSNIPDAQYRTACPFCYRYHGWRRCPDMAVYEQPAADRPAATEVGDVGHHCLSSAYSVRIYHETLCSR